MLVRYSAGGLLPVFEVLAKYGINIEEMENVVLQERHACACKIVVSGGNVHNITEILCQEIQSASGDILSAIFLQ
jgi:predicted amino acid-binding ACT domain protein